MSNSWRVRNLQHLALNPLKKNAILTTGENVVILESLKNQNWKKCSLQKGTLRCPQHNLCTTKISLYIYRDTRCITLTSGFKKQIQITNRYDLTRSPINMQMVKNVKSQSRLKKQLPVTSTLDTRSGVHHCKAKNHSDSAQESSLKRQISNISTAFCVSESSSLMQSDQSGSSTERHWPLLAHGDIQESSDPLLPMLHACKRQKKSKVTNQVKKKKTEKTTPCVFCWCFSVDPTMKELKFQKKKMGHSCVNSRGQKDLQIKKPNAKVP